MDKIVVLDANTIPRTHPLQRPAIPHEWVEYEHTAPGELVERCAGASVIATNKCRLTREVLTQLPAVRLIAELATGYNNIDIDCCRERGIAVATIQGYSTQSVAEHTLTMMLMLSRSMLTCRRAMERGEWIGAASFNLLPGPLVDLHGRTLTIVGSGSIGRRIAELAQAFGMQVLRAEHRGAPRVREGYTPFAEALAAADFLSLNCPLTPETAGLIGAAELAAMKPTAFVINNARGGVVNEAELVAALRAGRIAGAATDVASSEPLTADNPLASALELENLIITPHQAWMSEDSLRDFSRQFAANVEAFFRGEQLRRIV